MDQPRLEGDCTVKLAYAAKQLFRFYPIGHHDRGSAGEIILSALRRCERHLSVGYLIADAVKRCGRLVQSPGFSRQPLQIFRLFRGFHQHEGGDCRRVQQLLKPIEQTRLQIAREGGGRMGKFSLSKQRLVSFQIRRKVGSGQFRNGQSRCFLVRCKARNYT